MAKVRRMGSFLTYPHKHPRKQNKGKNLVHLETPGVYFVSWSNELDLVKIGMAANIKDRLSQYLTCNPHPLHIWGVIPTQTSDEAAELEKKLHKHFRDVNHCGEWFRHCSALQTVIDEQSSKQIRDQKWGRKGSKSAEKQLLKRREVEVVKVKKVTRYPALMPISDSPRPRGHRGQIKPQLVALFR